MSYRNELDGMTKDELIDEAIRLLTRTEVPAIERNRAVLSSRDELDKLRECIYNILPHLRRNS